MVPEEEGDAVSLPVVQVAATISRTQPLAVSVVAFAGSGHMSVTAAALVVCSTRGQRVPATIECPSLLLLS